MDRLGHRDRYLCDPAAIQAALQALPSIGGNNVTVTGHGDKGGPFTVQFTGSCANAVQPLLKASDPAVTVSEVSRGGNLPIDHHQRRDAVPLKSPMTSVANSQYGGYPGVNFLCYALPQSAPPFRPR